MTICSWPSCTAIPGQTAKPFPQSDPLAGHVVAVLPDARHADEGVRCEPWCGTRVRGWMVVVAVVSVRDDDGNVLVDVRVVAESDLGMLERRLPMPASLVVVRLGNPVLMLFNG
jgi:hypothetical protein